MHGVFYIVATPIGNLADISFRAIDVLQCVDHILAEDTRVTKKLLNHYNITPKNKIIVYNDHSDDIKRQKIVSLLSNGQSIAIVSDSGTPLISDPGYKLLQCIRSAGLHVAHIPGACSVITALVCSGLPVQSFAFFGFLPHSAKARESFVLSIAHYRVTMIFFESPHRLLSTLKMMLSILGNRYGAVCRELTKVFEECKYAKLDELIEYYTKNNPLGEVVLMVDGIKTQHDVDQNKTKEMEKVTKFLTKCFEHKLSVKVAVSCAYDLFNTLQKQKIYELALSLRNMMEHKTL